VIHYLVFAFFILNLFYIMSKISCAYCSGSGKDPFDLLSPISHCLVCGGTGVVETEAPVKICMFCSGTGKNPLGARIPCIDCGGKGINHNTG